MQIAIITGRIEPPSFIRVPVSAVIYTDTGNKIIKIKPGIFKGIRNGLKLRDILCRSTINEINSRNKAAP